MSKIETMYLDYINNFLSLEGFASFYGITMSTANRIVRLGHAIDNQWQVFNN